MDKVNQLDKQDFKADTTCKRVSRHQHDKNRCSRIATVDSCFALVGARQHCVAKICNASQRANLHKLQNDPFTISNSVL